MTDFAHYSVQSKVKTNENESNDMRRAWQSEGVVTTAFCYKN
jgi:hypothetical protein